MMIVDRFTAPPGFEINKQTAAHKFSGDPMAEYMFYLSVYEGQDEETGSTEWEVWAARFGKRILFADDQGSVWQVKYRDEAQAKTDFDSMNAAYGEWLTDDDPEDPVAVAERAGPWKSGYGEYPMADEIYDLTHASEPEEYDDYRDAYAPEDYDDEPNPYHGTYSEE